MSTTGLDVIDKTVHETNRWLKIVMEELPTADRRVAFTVLRATLHTLRDRLGPENAVHLGAQLPMLLRGAYYENWRLSESTSRERHLDQLFEHIRKELPREVDVTPQRAARAGFAALAESIDPDEVVKIIRILPPELRAVLRLPADSFH
jgi:uncharacterized protein (DUF2267 family)